MYIKVGGFNIEIEDYLDLQEPKKGIDAHNAQILKSRHQRDSKINTWGNITLCEKVLGESKCSVVEYFGGLGITTAALRDKFDIEMHTVVEIHPPLCRHLRDNFPDINVIEGDARKVAGKLGYHSLMLCDFPAFTILRLDDVDDIFSAELLRDDSPDYVVFTDSAWRWLSLNLKNYQNRGLPIYTKPDYIKVLSNMLYDRYGYSIKYAHTGIVCAYCLMVRGKVEVQINNIAGDDGSYNVHGKEYVSFCMEDGEK